MECTTCLGGPPRILQILKRTLINLFDYEIDVLPFATGCLSLVTTANSPPGSTDPAAPLPRRSEPNRSDGTQWICHTN